jgi:hypothetical protein
MLCSNRGVLWYRGTCVLSCVRDARGPRARCSGAAVRPGDGTQDCEHSHGRRIDRPTRGNTNINGYVAPLHMEITVLCNGLPTEVENSGIPDYCTHRYDRDHKLRSLGSFGSLSRPSLVTRLLPQARQAPRA